jgi:hypothetical protein
MRVFRRRHSLGLVALLALALQAALALAHVHVHAYPASASEGIAQRAITYGMCRAGTERTCPPQAPHDDHGKCSICLALGLASAAVLGAPPVLALPAPEFALLARDHRAQVVREALSVHFQARAPPQA